MKALISSESKSLDEIDITFDDLEFDNDNPFANLDTTNRKIEEDIDTLQAANSINLALQEHTRASKSYRSAWHNKSDKNEDVHISSVKDDEMNNDLKDKSTAKIIDNPDYKSLWEIDKENQYKNEIRTVEGAIKEAFKEFLL